MARRIEEAILDFYDCLLLAVKRPGERQGALERADFELERVRHYLRLCSDMGLISLRQYEFTSQSVVEIGRLLGGWRKKG